MPLYTLILLGTITVPLALSFDRRVRFYRQWKYLFPALAIVGLFYILFDIILTRYGVWGFNPEYHSNWVIAGLPVEEWLFFILVPYASIFLHDVLVDYFPRFRVSNRIARYISIAAIIILSAVVLLHTGKIYTVYIYGVMILLLLYMMMTSVSLLESFYMTYLVILVPFLIVNSILTGSFIEGEVVWYNNAENLGIRIFTIPIEDFSYGFTLILLNLILRDKFRAKFENR